MLLPALSMSLLPPFHLSVEGIDERASTGHPGTIGYQTPCLCALLIPPAKNYVLLHKIELTESPGFPVVFTNQLLNRAMRVFSGYSINLAEQSSKYPV